LVFWLENAYSGLFWVVVLGILTLKSRYYCSNPQRNANLAETRVLR